MTPEERARKCGPCWGDGLVSPKQCDEVYMCELHQRFEETIREAEKEAVDKDREANNWFNEVQILKDQTSGAFSRGRASMREEAADLVEFKTDMLETRYVTAKRIRAIPLFKQ